MLNHSVVENIDINTYLKQNENKEILRFLTCGNVDDGKSTLIGRLLHDSKMIYDDQLDAIARDSVSSGSATQEGIDLSLLVDGLQAEREQGITIDVAYRYFSTSKRKFIIADTPGHEQYTRNMATGASNCQLAIILVDARHGVRTQTRRHSYIASLLGIKHIIVAVNKMDLKDYSEDVFNAIRQEYMQFSNSLGLDDVHFIPLSALVGDNVVNSSQNMVWYKGPTLINLLENISIAPNTNTEQMRFPIQYVNRPNLDFRGYCGTVASGAIQQGDKVSILPQGKTSTVKSLVTYEGELDKAISGESITITLDDEIDISRGDMLVHSNCEPFVTDRFKAVVVWMAEQALVPGRQYGFKVGATNSTGIVERITHKVDVNTLDKNNADQLQINDIGECEISLSKPVVVDDYNDNRNTGAFIIIDRLTDITIGAGMIMLAN